MLERFADGVFCVARPQRFWGLETGTRMTVLRLSDGGLFVHCPVALDRALRREVDALGEVRAIAASSLFHHLYAGAWAAAYPDAVFAACPGLDEKRDDLMFDHVMRDEPHAAWAADLDQVFMSSRFEKEVVFFHRASRTLVCADALLNLASHPSPATRLVARVMGNTGPGKGWPERIAVKDRRACRDEVDRILAWDIDGVVLAHGDLVPEGGREAVRDAYAWVG